MKKIVLFLQYGLLAAFLSCHTTAPGNGSSHASAVGDTLDDTGFPAWSMTPFVKADSVNPILTPGTGRFMDPILRRNVSWEIKDVFNPAAVVRDGRVWLLYRAEDTIGRYAGTSRLGLAVSSDGLHFRRMPQPVFYPGNDSMKRYEWEGGVEDPRLVESEDSTYILTYTAYDGKTARLCLATSKDLLHWQKRGLALTGGGEGRYRDLWSKSGAIVARREGNRIVACRINGKYWMYWGDTNIYIAVSEDLIHWTPLTEQGKMKVLFSRRSGRFDSRLVEGGPYALLRDDGILFIYNGMNDAAYGDTALPAGAYCGGQVLIDRDDPTRVIARLEKSFIRPDKPYEISGQVNEVCFLEGLASFRGRWFLYYGTADSRIAVAVYEPGGR